MIIQQNTSRKNTRSCWDQILQYGWSAALRQILKEAQDENETETTYKEFEGDYWDNTVNIEYTPDRKVVEAQKGGERNERT